MDQESFGAADVQYPVARFQAVMRDQLFREGTPAAVIFVTAVAVAPVAVEIVFAELFGDLRARGLVVFHDPLDVIALRRVVNAGNEIEVRHANNSTTDGHR